MARERSGRRHGLAWFVTALTLSTMGCADFSDEARAQATKSLREKKCQDVRVKVDPHDRRAFDFSGKCAENLLCEGVVEFESPLWPTEAYVKHECRLNPNACTPKVPEHCAKLGDAADAVREVNNANRFWAKACAGGHGASCRKFALNKINGKGEPKNVAKGIALLAKACTAGDGDSCTYLGYRYEAGRGVKKDLPKAVALYKRGCHELKAGGSCNNLSFLHNLGLGVKKDLVTGGKLAAKGCEYGDKFACAFFAYIQVRGSHGTKRNVADGLARLKKDCAKPVGLACLNLGFVLRDGHAGSVDLPGSGRAFEKGCAASHAASCNSLGLAYRDGKGKPKDAVKAFGLFEKSCRGKNKFGCLNAARAFRHGLGTARSRVLMMSRYESACSYGLRTACRELKAVRSTL